MVRCAWPQSELDIQYHDIEWGVPVFDDRKLFEFLILEGAQAGLSWSTILNKREGYRQAFAEFDPAEVASFGPNVVEDLMLDGSIVRNRLKILGAITNAKTFLEVQSEFGSFGMLLWSFVGHKPIVNYWKSLSEIPAETEESRAMSKELKRRGFKFVGPTICYAMMQATGLVNDHSVDCFRHTELAKLATSEALREQLMLQRDRR